MYTFVLVLQVIACLIIIASILLQPAKEGNMALMSGGSASQNVGQTNPLFKVSMWAGIFLLSTSLLLSWYKVKERRQSVIDTGALPAETAPAAPVTTPVTTPTAAATEAAAPAPNSAPSTPAPTTPAK